MTYKTATGLVLISAIALGACTNREVRSTQTINGRNVQVVHVTQGQLGGTGNSIGHYVLIDGEIIQCEDRSSDWRIACENILKNIPPARVTVVPKPVVRRPPTPEPNEMRRE